MTQKEITERMAACTYNLKRVAAAKAKWEKAVGARKEYIKKHSDRKVMWLVKFEYHT